MNQESHLNASSQAFSTVFRSLVVIFCLTLRPSMVLFMLKQYLKAENHVEAIPKSRKRQNIKFFFRLLRFKLVSCSHLFTLGVIVSFELLCIIHLKEKREKRQK